MTLARAAAMDWTRRIVEGRLQPGGGSGGGERD